MGSNAEKLWAPTRLLVQTCEEAPTVTHLRR
jgi:hypothetical protein